MGEILNLLLLNAWIKQIPGSIAENPGDGPGMTTLRDGCRLREWANQMPASRRSPLE
jgi:hypothetical protein